VFWRAEKTIYTRITTFISAIKEGITTRTNNEAIREAAAGTIFLRRNNSFHSSADGNLIGKNIFETTTPLKIKRKAPFPLSYNPDNKAYRMAKNGDIGEHVYYRVLHGNSDANNIG
jgi:hypothetical protein